MTKVIVATNSINPKATKQMYWTGRRFSFIEHEAKKIHDFRDVSKELRKAASVAAFLGGSISKIASIDWAGEDVA